MPGKFSFFSSQLSVTSSGRPSQIPLTSLPKHFYTPLWPLSVLSPCFLFLINTYHNLKWSNFSLLYLLSVSLTVWGPWLSCFLLCS